VHRCCRFITLRVFGAIISSRRWRCLNIGGVANVTWIGADKILAFDTGPGNALIDDCVKQPRLRATYDPEGALATAGTIDKKILERLLADQYFKVRPPKSLDRDHWTCDALKKLSVEDGAATLAAFTVEAVKKATGFFPGAAAAMAGVRRRAA
jgi:anhydro-N-acetylmuramic acid kinase